MILGEKAHEAFDIDKEDPKLAETYGKSPLGLHADGPATVEAGVTFVTVDMPHWDDHPTSRSRARHEARSGGHRRVGPHFGPIATGNSRPGTVMVMGEFGRTPRINNGQPGIAIPGRDHWGDATAADGRGGLKGATVIGQTNAKAEYPVELPAQTARRAGDGLQGDGDQ
jgi:hypothetical protein